ncbi:MAG TPA: hypothetical protein VGE74_30640 [Gemmata sp.]
MSEATAHLRGSIREILKATTFTRDALPYSDEFERHDTPHAAGAGDRVTRQQFWRALSSAAKKGGWKGKKRGAPAPSLGHQHEDTLWSLLAGRLGERDDRPSSADFDTFRQRFNQTTGLSLTEREFWRAVCSVCKQPLRDDVELLLTQAVDSMTNAVDHFNGSSERGSRRRYRSFSNTRARCPPGRAAAPGLRHPGGRDRLHPLVRGLPDPCDRRGERHFLNGTRASYPGC